MEPAVEAGPAAAGAATGDVLDPAGGWRSDSDDSDGGYDPLVSAPHEKHNPAIHQLGARLEQRNVHHMLEAARTLKEGPHQLSVHVATANMGNEVPPVSLHPWVPSGGLGSSIIVACGQEATYADGDRIRESVIGRLQGIIIGADQLVPPDSENDCDPYCVLFLESDFPSGKGKPDKSKKMSHTETWHIVGDGKPVLNPTWNAHFDIDDENPKKFLKKNAGTGYETEAVETVGPAAKKQAIPFLDVLPSTRRLKVQVFDWDKNSANDLIGEFVQDVETVPLRDGLVAENRITRVPDIGKLRAAMAELTSGKIELKLKGKTTGFVKLKVDYMENLSVAMVEKKLETEKHGWEAAQADRIREKSKCQGSVSIKIVQANDLLASDGKSRGQKFATSDSYCDVFVVNSEGKAMKFPTGSTKVLHQDLDPKWEHDVPAIEIDENVAGIELKVMDWDKISADDLIGHLYLPSEYLVSLAGEPKTDRTFFLSHEDLPQGQLILQIEFTPSANPKPISSFVYDEPVADDDDFFNKVIRNAGSGYEIVGQRVGDHAALKKKFGQMKIIVLAKKSILAHFSAARWETENTGIAALRNKGGIIARFEYMGSPMCFVSSHLAAHEGTKHCRERTEMAKQIQREGRPAHANSKCSQFDLGNQFDQIIWAGDLNFRQEDPTWFTADWQGEMDKKQQHLKKLDEIKGYVASEDWKALHENDELRREMKIGQVFSGFNDTMMFDGSILPTFKMVRGKTYRYFGQRVPSYTDRILVSSNPGAVKCIHKECFYSAPTIGTSDHKPVYGRFRMSVPTPFAARRAQCDDGAATTCVLRLDGVRYTCFNDWLPPDSTINLEFVTPVSMVLGRSHGGGPKSYSVTAKFPSVDGAKKQSKGQRKFGCCGSIVQDGPYKSGRSHRSKSSMMSESCEPLEFTDAIVLPTKASTMDHLVAATESPTPGHSESVLYSEVLSVRVTDGSGEERGFGRIPLRDVQTSENYSWGGLFELDTNGAGCTFNFGGSLKPTAIAIVPADAGDETLDSTHATASGLLDLARSPEWLSPPNESTLHPDSTRAYAVGAEHSTFHLEVPSSGKYAIYFRDYIAEAGKSEAWFAHDSSGAVVLPDFDTALGHEVEVSRSVISSRVELGSISVTKAVRRKFRVELSLNGVFVGHVAGLLYVIDTKNFEEKYASREHHDRGCC